MAFGLGSVRCILIEIFGWPWRDSAQLGSSKGCQMSSQSIDGSAANAWFLMTWRHNPVTRRLIRNFFATFWGVTKYVSVKWHMICLTVKWLFSRYSYWGGIPDVWQATTWWRTMHINQRCSGMTCVGGLKTHAMADLDKADKDLLEHLVDMPEHLLRAALERVPRASQPHDSWLPSKHLSSEESVCWRLVLEPLSGGSNRFILT